MSIVKSVKVEKRDWGRKNLPQRGIRSTTEDTEGKGKGEKGRTGE